MCSNFHSFGAVLREIRTICGKALLARAALVKSQHAASAARKIRVCVGGVMFRVNLANAEAGLRLKGERGRVRVDRGFKVDGQMGTLQTPSQRIRVCGTHSKSPGSSAISLCTRF